MGIYRHAMYTGTEREREREFERERERAREKEREREGVSHFACGLSFTFCTPTRHMLVVVVYMHGHVFPTRYQPRSRYRCLAGTQVPSTWLLVPSALPAWTKAPIW